MEKTKKQLDELAVKLLQFMKSGGLVTDCWSTRGSGKATENCDVAIDVKNEKSAAELVSWFRSTGFSKVFPTLGFTFEKDPYKTGTKIIRIKFVEMTEEDLKEKTKKDICDRVKMYMLSRIGDCTLYFNDSDHKKSGDEEYYTFTTAAVAPTRRDYGVFSLFIKSFTIEIKVCFYKDGKSETELFHGSAHIGYGHIPNGSNGHDLNINVKGRVDDGNLYEC